MKVALDAMGGDHAPAVNIGGAKEALQLYPVIEKIFLVGDQAVLEAECAKQGLSLSDPRVQIVHAPETIGMAEPGAKTVRRKKQSSINIAMDMVKAGEAHAFISAGNTGAAVASATIKLRLIEGVDRAGIASGLPNEHGVCYLLDAGANPEAKPEHLLTYAIMGSAFATGVKGAKRPKVGLMSNGEEDEKGTTFTKETFALLKQFADSGKAPFEFIGNVEGHDLFETELDVVLCDGFTGNVVLKSCEATAKAMFKWLKQELMATKVRMIGARIAKGAFVAMKERTSAESYGGSPLLGVNGVVIIAHGGSTAIAVRNAIRVGMETYEHKVNPHIEETLAKVAQP
jgi:glycerol-3-phosphate acyltransferase PlsX